MIPIMFAVLSQSTDLRTFLGLTPNKRLIIVPEITKNILFFTAVFLYSAQAYHEKLFLDIVNYLYNTMYLCTTNRFRKTKGKSHVIQGVLLRSRCSGERQVRRQVQACAGNRSASRTS
jgi:hypothetical protein